VQAAVAGRRMGGRFGTDKRRKDHLVRIRTAGVPADAS
jgi:hypothetical protein